MTKNNVNRTFLVLIYSFVLVLVMLFLRNKYSELKGLYPNVFWGNKMSWRKCADVVVAGDSRVYRAIDPRSMEILLGGKIYNYGFSGLGFSEPYLQGIRELLDPACKQKIVVLGITPHSLTEGAVERNGFQEERDTLTYKDRNKLQDFINMYEHIFRPVQDHEAANMFSFGFYSNRYLQEYYANGWVASERYPENPERALRSYSTIFDHEQDGPVSMHAIECLIDNVKKLVEQGIIVFGFRPPTSLKMIQLENLSSCFDESSFIESFEEAGGIWLETDQDGYHSYDGSHLRRDAAEKLSSDLAKRIQLFLNNNRNRSESTD